MYRCTDGQLDMISTTTSIPSILYEYSIYVYSTSNSYSYVQSIAATLRGLGRYMCLLCGHDFRGVQMLEPTFLSRHPPKRGEVF
jgi:hypothetical protein